MKMHFNHLAIFIDGFFCLRPLLVAAAFLAITPERSGDCISVVGSLVRFMPTTQTLIATSNRTGAQHRRHALLAAKVICSFVFSFSS